jgi:hypothetical protein
MLSGKNDMPKHVGDLLNCPPAETKHVSNMLRGKIYTVNDLAHFPAALRRLLTVGGFPLGAGV